MKNALFVTAASLFAFVSIAACASPPAEEDTASAESAATSCARQRVLRPAYPLTDCPGADRDGALCYPACNPGFHGAGPVCWQDCPPGYTDDGATCRRDAHIIGANNDACPWYDKCGLTLSKGCSTCPEGYVNDGCTCRRDVHIFAKDSYGRGVGSPMSCAPGRQQIGALCYGSCDPGWEASGVECLGATICQDVPDPKPQPQLGRFCFKVTRSSWVDPCDVFVQYAKDEAEAKQIVQSLNVGDAVTAISCTQETTACSSTRSLKKKLPGRFVGLGD